MIFNSNLLFSELFFLETFFYVHELRRGFRAKFLSRRVFSRYNRVVLLKYFLVAAYRELVFCEDVERYN